MDRLDLLMTERNSPLQKSHILKILNVLAYFRPKKSQRATKVNQAYGEFTKSEQ